MDYPLDGVIYGSNLSDGRIYVIDAATGVIEQVIDPFPAGGAGFLSDPYPADQVVWAIEINECTRQVFFIQQNVAGELRVYILLTLTMQMECWVINSYSRQLTKVQERK